MPDDSTDNRLQQQNARGATGSEDKVWIQVLLVKLKRLSCAESQTEKELTVIQKKEPLEMKRKICLREVKEPPEKKASMDKFLEEFLQNEKNRHISQFNTSMTW